MIQFCNACEKVRESERGPAEKFQDEKYGKNQRVHNWRPPNDRETPKPRCTICGT